MGATLQLLGVVFCSRMLKHFHYGLNLILSPSTYEHAVLAAGTDFRSDKLWEMYINWENEQSNLKAVTAVFDRILGIPTQLYSHHFQR